MATFTFNCVKHYKVGDIISVNNQLMKITSTSSTSFNARKLNIFDNSWIFIKKLSLKIVSYFKNDS